MLSISWIPIEKKNLLGVSQFPGKNLNNFFDLSLFAKDLEIINKQKIKNETSNQQTTTDK